MAFFIDNTGGINQIELGATLYKEAFDANLSVPNYINRKFASADLKLGDAFSQICASEGLALPGSNAMGLRASTVGEVLDGKSGINALANSKDQGSPFGSSARSLFPAALIEIVENSVLRDYETDTIVFGDMVAADLAVGSENFLQPVISYSGAGGPNNAKAQRISQFSEVPNLIRFGTSERPRSIGVYGIGMEFSQQALRSTTLDLVALTLGRFLMVEKDARVYEYLSGIFSGDGDMNIGAVPAVSSTSLDSASTGGVLTHRAWVKFLARNRKKRTITHVVCDIDTYLKIEGRASRPGTTNYDPTLARIDPQATATNQGFGNDVKVFIVDSAAEGGPVPVNTVWALDKSKGIVRVSNTAASYSSAETFALRRSEAFVTHYSETVYRMYGDADLSAFDCLTIV